MKNNLQPQKMPHRVKLIYNPASGENAIADYLDPIIELYQSKGFSIIPYRLSFGQPEDTITADLDDTYHHILIAGGDGTVNYVINLLKRAGINIPVAILPTGTANDFATTLGMPMDVIKGCKAILDGKERRVDLGQVNGTWFVNVFSCGLFTDISQKTPTIVKNNFGKIAYYMNGLGELPRFRKLDLNIHTDAGDFDGKALIFFVFNGRTAGQIPIAYLSEVDDGKLDVIIVKGDTPLETIPLAIRYLSRWTRRAKYPKGIVHLRCTHLTAHSVRPETTDIDGQPGPGFPIEIDCRPGALRVICPQTKGKLK